MQSSISSCISVSTDQLGLEKRPEISSSSATTTTSITGGEVVGQIAKEVTTATSTTNGIDLLLCNSESNPLQQNNHLVELQRLSQLECAQVELLKKLCLMGESVTTGNTSQQISDVGKEINELLEKQKATLSKILSLFTCAATTTTTQSTRGTGVETTEKENNSYEGKIFITTQPAEIAVVNRYLVPTPVVAVSADLPQATLMDKLCVRVRLLYHPSLTPVEKDILQGIKDVSVTPGGRAVFAKLKVTEVSSKHARQRFSFEFVLEREQSGSSTDSIFARTISAPFHVQSRATKRKRTAEPDEVTGPIKRSRSSISLPLAEQRNEETTTVTSSVRSSASDTATRDLTKFPSLAQVDITDLLTLPQKDAARRLGISESMLCKRFKECTKRKWPYRSLRKIDKMINIYQLRQANGVLPDDDSGKLQQLIKERQEWLTPVQIRITSSDHMSTTSVCSTPMSDLDEDIPFDALETLEMLRMGVRESRDVDKDIRQSANERSSQADLNLDSEVGRALDQLKLLKNLAPLVYTTDKHGGEEDEILPTSDPSSPLALRTL